jgi:hypothetical protein
MSRGFLRWLHRQAALLGSADSSRFRPGCGPNAQFISYLAESGARQVNADHYEASLRRRRLGKGLLLWLLGAGGAWVIIESAKAISMF